MYIYMYMYMYVCTVVHVDMYMYMYMCVQCAASCRQYVHVHEFGWFITCISQMIPNLGPGVSHVYTICAYTMYMYIVMEMTIRFSKFFFHPTPGGILPNACSGTCRASNVTNLEK